MMNYENEIVDSIVLIDYDLCELRIIRDYFKDLLAGKNAMLSKSFFEGAVESHKKYNNDLNFQLKRIKVKLELNSQLEELEKINVATSERMEISDIFVTYTEDLERLCLRNYLDLCNKYIKQIEKERELLKELIK